MTITSKPALPCLQRSHPFAWGLQGAWVMTEGSGLLTRDYSGHGKHATFGGTVAWAPDRSLSFNNGYANPGITHPAGTNVTVFAEVKNPGNWYVFGTHPTNGGQSFFLGKAASVATFRYNNGGERVLDGTSNISDGRWHRIMGITSASNAWLLVDGQVEDSEAVGGVYQSRAVYLGCQEPGNNVYTGYMRSVLFWYNRTFTLGEARTLMADPYDMFRSRSAKLSVAATQNIPAGTTTVHLAWTDNSEGEDGFSIERKAGAGAYAVVHTTAAGVETWDDTSLPEGETYTYRIRATSAAKGDSEYSNEAEVTV
jgi:hypothetical protein